MSALSDTTTCGCSVDMRFHALNCPVYPGQPQRLGEEFVDHQRHSVRHDVWAQLKEAESDKVGKAHRSMGDIREAFDALEAHEARLFQRYEEARAGLESVGVVAQLKFSARREASYREWIRKDSDEPLPKVFTEVPDAPIGPEHA